MSTFHLADPLYIGEARRKYSSHPDYAGEVDHAELIDRMCSDFDGCALCLSAKSLRGILAMCPSDVIVLAWFKPAAVPLGDHRRYSWEPVIMRPVRRYRPGYVPIACIAATPGYTFRETPGEHVMGEKPEAFVHWVFANAGLREGDQVTDPFPDSGAISRASKTYISGPTVSDGYRKQSDTAGCLTLFDDVEEVAS